MRILDIFYQKSMKNGLKSKIQGLAWRQLKYWLSSGVSRGYNKPVEDYYLNIISKLILI